MEHFNESILAYYSMCYVIGLLLHCLCLHPIITSTHLSRDVRGHQLSKYSRPDRIVQNCRKLLMQCHRSINGLFKSRRTRRTGSHLAEGKSIQRSTVTSTVTSNWKPPQVEWVGITIQSIKTKNGNRDKYTMCRSCC